MNSAAKSAGPPLPAPLLACRNVCVRRNGRAPRRIIADVSFELAAGEAVSIIGPNGSGKTTLLLALLGLLPVERGAVLLAGRPVHSLSPRDRARIAAYVPQRLEHAPPFRVAEAVADGRFARHATVIGLSPADDEAVQHALARCGLSALAERRFDTLSGGERQKVLLAAAFAQDPQILFLDEPTSALDPAVQIDVARLLHDWRASGRAMVIVAHDLQLPAALETRVIALRGGRVVADGAAAEVLCPHTLGLVYDAPFRVAGAGSPCQIVLPDWWHGGHGVD